MSKLQKLETLLEVGLISRREFLKRSAQLGVAASLAPSLMASTAKAATPMKGGRFRMGLTGGATSDSIDPAKLAGMMQWHIAWQCRNNLVEIDHNSLPQPELAESWEASPDAKVWNFKLKKGVEFHNGKTMDAKDVVFSIRHHMSEDSKSGAKGVLKPVTDIKAEDKHSVTFTLAAGSADFPFLLADYHLQVVPDDTKDFEDGMGTGAYVLENFEPGVRSFAKKNPNYFKSDRGWFDEVETLGISDSNARTNALRTGQIDAMDRCERKTFHMFMKVPGIKGLVTTGFKHYTFAMLTDQKPYDNQDTRLALKYAFDREMFLNQILRGYGVVGNDHPISPANRYHNDKMAQRVYDPDKAKFHAKKAGIADQVFNLHVAETGFPGSVDAGVLYKEQAAKAGIEINVVRVPEDGYWSDVWMKKGWCAVYWGGRPTEDWMFSTSYAAEAPWNDTHWKNVRFNELLVAARAELDDAKRRAMYFEMQEIVSNDGGVVVPAFASDLFATTDKVGHAELAGNWEMDGMKPAERWWFV